ncbi:coiled-coil domain-containing protein 190-like [Pseudophryne corroboree]|uniref:coiled-coil domain-containing protein 190-like n=1 Tax=Pseudophryne corroboree TaxID=495146 RepID=UPI003081CC2B
MDKQWEADRRGAKRAEARLSNGIHDIEEAQHYHMNSMTREQKRLQKDLIRIKQATAKKITNPRNVKQNFKSESSQMPGTMTGKRGQPTSLDLHGVSTRRNQPVSSPEIPVVASGSSMTLQMRINDFMDGVGNRKGKTESLSVQRNGAEPSLSGPNMIDAKVSAGRRLSISSVTDDTTSKNDVRAKSSGLQPDTSDKTFGSTRKSVTEDTPSKQALVSLQFVRQRRSSLFKEKPIFDEEIYAPDGALRTLHTMPDFMDSLEEAKSARYIRHKIKPEAEKELSLGEIFQKDNTEDLPKDEMSEIVI